MENPKKLIQTPGDTLSLQSGVQGLYWTEILEPYTEVYTSPKAYIQCRKSILGKLESLYQKPIYNVESL